MHGQGKIALSTVLGGLLLFANTTGCGPSASSICSDIDECVGLSNRDFEDCVDDIEDLERDADREGCLEEYDEALLCFEDTFRCRDDRVETRCGDEVQDLNRCIN
jgi:hypothetical protein